MPSLDIVIPAYNADQVIDATLEAAISQHRAESLEVGIIVVNNDSTDATGDKIDAWSHAGVRRIDHVETRSRSAARNAGAHASRADFLLFLDADCRLAGNDNLEAIAAAILDGAIAGFGYATGTGVGFWAKYYRDLERRRLDDDWRGWTTQLFFVRKQVFDSVNGFSEAYTRYGFEDRDFFCRLIHRAGDGQLQTIPTLRAYHDPDTSLTTICEKAYESGRYSSGLFRSSFPSEYSTLPYARVDVDNGSRPMIALLRILSPAERVILRLAGLITKRANAPVALARPFVLLCTALSYFRGTRDRSRQETPGI